MVDLDRLLVRLSYSCRDSGLFITALTHRSFGVPHYERLEFLGDAVLNCVVSDLLYARFPDLPEGDLTRLRANLVRQDSLHAIALKLGLGEFLRLGDGELKSGGHQRPSILADVVEAILGAVYTDGGFAEAHRVAAALYTESLAAIDLGKALKDPKTRLQEWLQGRHEPLPVYTLGDPRGSGHAQEFEVECVIASRRVATRGKGTSRRAAEQMAAERALQRLEKEHHE